MYRWWMAVACLVGLVVAVAAPPPVVAQCGPPAGPPKGVTFYYLNGGTQDFGWVLQNQSDPAVRARIDGTLAEYRSAGVNYIRLLIHHWIGGYPDPPQSLIDKVKSFLEITRTGPNAGKFRIEIVFGQPRTTDPDECPTVPCMVEAAPYTNSQKWISTWMANLDFATNSHIGMIMIEGDLVPCDWSGTTWACGDAAALSSTRRQAAWVVANWKWFHDTYDWDQKSSYELILGYGSDASGLDRLGKTVAWAATKTSSIPYLAGSFYFDGQEPPGAPWQNYATRMQAHLNKIKQVTTKPLWIDEFGAPIGSVGAGTYTDLDQSNYIGGVLAATNCWDTVDYPKFGWVGGNDYPYGGAYWYGLFSGFSGSNPVVRPGWSNVSLYYNPNGCD